MNNLTHDDIASFKRMSLSDLVALAGMYYMEGNDEEVVVCFNHLAKRLELEEHFRSALSYAVADAHLSATINDYSSSALSLSLVANVLSAIDDGDECHTLPAYYTSFMSLSHLLGFRYLSLDDVVPPTVSEDNIGRFSFLQELRLDLVSQNVDYAFSAHSTLGIFALEGSNTCIRHILNNVSRSIAYLDAILKASKRTAGLIEANNVLMDSAVSYVRLLIMRYRDTREFAQRSKTVPIGLLSRNLRLRYNIALCTHACIHYASRCFWCGFDGKRQLTRDSKGWNLSDSATFGAVLEKLTFASSASLLLGPVQRKIETIFNDVITDLKLSNCSSVVRASCLLEFVELMGRYPLLTWQFSSFVEDRVSSLGDSLDDDVRKEIQETLELAAQRYRFFTNSILIVDRSTTCMYSDPISLNTMQRSAEISDLRNVPVNSRESDKDSVLLIMSGLAVFPAAAPGVVALLYSFLQVLDTLRADVCSVVKLEHAGSEKVKTTHLIEVISHVQSVVTLLSTAIDSTFLDKSLFYFSWHLTADFCSEFANGSLNSSSTEFTAVLLEVVILALQYMLVVLQELEASSASEALDLIAKEVIKVGDDSDGSDDHLLDLVMNVHTALLSIVGILLTSEPLRPSWEKLIGLISATYILACDVLSYREKTFLFARFLRAVLHGFYSSPEVVAVVRSKDSAYRAELLDLMMEVCQIASVFLLDAAFEQHLPNKDSGKRPDTVIGQIKALLAKMSQDHSISCTKLQSRKLFSYDTAFDMDKWMMANKIVKQARHKRTRSVFIEQHPHIQSAIRKLDTEKMYTAKSSIFKTITAATDTRDTDVDAVHELEPDSEPVSENTCPGDGPAMHVPNCVPTSAPRGDTDEDDIVTVPSEPVLKVAPVRTQGEQSTASVNDLMKAPAEDQRMQAKLIELCATHGLNPRELVRLSTLPGERLISVDATHLRKYVEQEILLPFVYYLIKQILNAEDITASTIAGAHSRVYETLLLFFSNLCATREQATKLLLLAISRKSKLSLQLSRSPAAQEVFLAVVGMAVGDPHVADISPGYLTEGSSISLTDSSVPFAALLHFLLGVGHICNRAAISITRCTEVAAPVWCTASRTLSLRPLSATTTIEHLDLTGSIITQTIDVPCDGDGGTDSTVSRLMIDKLFLNAATFSASFLASFIRANVHITAICMHDISLPVLKDISKASYEDIRGLKAIEVSCIDRAAAEPYYRMMEAFRGFGIDVCVVQT